MTKKIKLIGITVFFLSLLLLISSCSSPAVQEVPGEYDQELASEAQGSPLNVEEEVDAKTRIDLSLKPNEAGKIMVLMYHGIDETEKEWVRTPENFRKDLTALYDQGYRPISLTDYVSGNIITDQGYSPVVITFDDALENNFRYLEDGSIDPDCAVGVLLDFKETHPDFPLQVTFFADGPVAFGPKAEEREKINFIIEQGMDIGNHTLDHVNFKNSDQAEIEYQIGCQARYLDELIECENYKVNTLALPYGSRPKEELMSYLQKGSYEGFEYENVAILNVGSKPGFSPYHTDFNPLSIPRVRASEMNVGNLGIYSYLDYFIKHPEERFISDGMTKIITVPQGSQENLVETDRELYIYETLEEVEESKDNESDS